MSLHDVVIVMTRLPREGGNKTRLIPALGAAGATALHDRLARHAVGRASSYVMMHPGSRMQIHLDGGTPAEGRSWLGDSDFQVQPDGDLGKRMQSAVDLAFFRGARRVLVIGTDCPSINESLLGKAFRSLDEADVVFGPAADGGYYLVGLSRPCPGIFGTIDWGGPLVLIQSLAAAKRSGCHTAMLEVLSDVDLPEDLPAAVSILTQGTSLSVILSTSCDEPARAAVLDGLKLTEPHEIILADRGGNVRNVEIARQTGTRMKAAGTATGEFLLFVPGGTVLPPEFKEVIAGVMQSPVESAGVFHFGLAGNSPITRFDGLPVDLDSQLSEWLCRNEGVFMRRRIFQHASGNQDRSNKREQDPSAGCSSSR